MRAVILAAGSGNRLAPMGWDKPKCLLQFGEKTILDNAIAALLEHGVDRVCVVVGYRQKLVLEALEQYPVRADVVVNPDYASTNTIHSIYLARDHLDEDFLYFNADVLFDPKILSKLLAHQGTAFAIEEKTCGQEEVKVIVNESGRITRIGKALPPGECLGEFIGIAKFDRSTCPALISSLRRFNVELNSRNLFFEAAVDDILVQHAVLALPIGELRAIEIDTPDDYLAAQQLWESREAES